MINATISTQTFRTQMDLIVKDYQKVNELIAYVEKYEAATPFDLPELQKATVLFTKLTKIRDESLDKVPEYLRLAGEMSAIFDKPLEKAVEGLFKTFSGSALGLTILRNNFGVTKAELEKFGVAFDKSGRIQNFSQQIDKVEIALKKIFQNLSGMKLAEARSQTLAGRLSTLGSEVYRTARAFGDMMAPSVSLLTDRMIVLMGVLQNLSPEVKSAVALFVLFGGVMGTLIVSFGPVFFFLNQMVGAFIALSRVAGPAGASGAAILMRTVVTPLPALLARLAVALTSATAGVSILATALTGLSQFVGVLILAFVGAGGGLAGAAAVVGTSFSAAAMAVTGLVSAFAAAVPSAVLYRAGLMGVAYAAVKAYMELNKLIGLQNQVNKENEQRSEKHDSRKTREAIDFALNRPSKEDLAKKSAPTTITAETVADMADTLSSQVLVDTAPEHVKKAYRSGKGPEQIKKMIEALEASKAERKGAEAGDLADVAPILKEWDRLEKKKMSKADRAKAVADYLSSAAGKASRWYEGDENFNKDITASEVAKAVKMRENFAQSKGKSAGESRQAELEKKALSTLKDELKYYEALAKVKDKVMTIDLATEKITNIKNASKNEIDTAEQTYKRLLELRRGFYDAEGNFREEFQKIDQAAQKELHANAGKLLDERLSKIRQAMEDEEAAGELSAAKRKKYLMDQRAEIERTAKDYGTAMGGNPIYTKEMLEQEAKLFREEKKLQREAIKNQQAISAEVQAIEKGDYVAKMHQLNLETQEKKRQSVEQKDIVKWRAHQELIIEQERANKIRDIENAIKKNREDAAESIVSAARSKAEYALGRGKGSYTDVQAAREAADAVEDKKAARSRDEEILKAQEEAKLDVEKRKNLKEIIAAIKERYKAEQDGRVENRRQRDEDFAKEEENKRRTQAINAAKSGQAARDFQLESLKERQQAGEDVSEQMMRIIREKYETAVKIANEEAKAAAMNADAAEQAQIEADRKQKILELTRAATKEMRDQLALKRAEDDKKRQTNFFSGGVMTYEESQDLEKKRSAENYARYQRMVDKEKNRTGGVSAADREAMNKLNVPSDIQNAAINPVWLKIEPVKVDLNLTLKQPDGSTQSTRVQTSTDRKNETKTKSDTNQKGKPNI